MANMSDPRVPRVLAHAEACLKTEWGTKKPSLPDDLKDLSGIDLSNTRLQRTNFSGANLRDANFTGAYLDNADFTGADLAGAEFKDAHLIHARIGFTDLTGVKITRGQLISVYRHDVADYGYPKEVAEKVILLQERNPISWERKAKKRLVVELRSDGKLHIKTPIFKY